MGERRARSMCASLCRQCVDAGAARAGRRERRVAVLYACMALMVCCLGVW